MFLNLILFFVGFYILIKGANFLVDGASSFARKLNIPSLVIGLVIVGIGTSIPEFATTFIANLTDKPEIGIGTIIGSNIFNMLFILGVSSLFFPLALKQYWVDRDLIWNIMAIAIASFFIVSDGGTISRLEGLFLLIVFGIWLYLVIKKHKDEKEEQAVWKTTTWPLAMVMIIAGFIGVILGGKWVVDGATIIARELHMSESFIGLTIVGIGTSLPELIVSFVAAYKKQIGIAFGNIIGSNIFDFLMILGVSALTKPIIVAPQFITDTIIVLLSAAFLYSSMFVREQYILKRWQGLAMIFLYILYFVYLIGRG